MPHLVGPLLLTCFSIGTPPADEAGAAFFESKIRPVLVTSCAECHSAPVGKKGPKGGFRVDSREAMRKGGDSGPAVVPGKPDESLLLEVIRYGEALRMPPKGKLPDSVVADFEKWIKMGAPDPRGETAAPPSKGAVDVASGRNHWAYRPVKKTSAPKPRNSAWASSTIDAFVAAGHEAAGIEPNSEADRRTLIRRLSFDLLGLPPSPAEIAAFEADASPYAYERLVDRMLESPAFGERWGRHWLDIARFAESVTLRGMIHKEAWRYRDYVIDNFNKDRPLDRFIREQIAGDLLPADSVAERRSGIVATTYLAIGNWNLEEQDKDQLRMDVVDEQLDAISKGLLAQTVTCARCHDHKFDPIPTRDYYALAGILRNARAMEHDNVSKWVERPLPMSPEVEAVVVDREKAVAELERRIKEEKAKLAKSGKTQGAGVVAPSKLRGIVIDDVQAKKVGRWVVSRFNNAYIGDGYLHDEDGGKGEKTVTFQPENLPAGEYDVRLGYTPGTNRSTAVPVTVMSVDGEKTVTVDLRAAPPVEGRFVSLGKYRFEKGGLAYVLVSNEGTKGHVVVDAVQFLPADAPPAPNASPIDAAAARTLRTMEAELKKLSASGPKRDLASSVLEERTIEDARVHVRGNVHVLGETAPRGFLSVVSNRPASMPSDESGRRELAEWLVAPDNPLTARVYVNRVWHWLFGEGLVRTTDNFGTTGEPPSHPELLDALALEFREDGWSTKRLVKRIVMSRTYRLSSGPNPAAAAVDPENRKLARANRKRIDAECVRDAILVVSGRLDRTAGGPTFPEEIAADYGFTADSTRRSVYLPVFRNAIPELFELFDFADPSVVVGRRNAATVASQALFMMNHPFIMDQAKAAAERLTRIVSDDSTRLDFLYKSALGRGATEGERRIALGFLDAASKANKPSEKDARAMLIQAVFATPDFRTLD